MIGWQPWVMWRAVCALLVVAGCWSEDPLVDGELTSAQLAALRVQLRRPVIDPCKLAKLAPEQCDVAALLGQELFFDVRLSDQLDPADPTGMTTLAGTGTTACSTCHDPDGYFIDTRPQHNVSHGQVKWTKRNSMTVLDVGLKYAVAGSSTAFTWDGGYPDPGAVLDLAVKKAMSTGPATVPTVIGREPLYRRQYAFAIGLADQIAGAELALDAYMFRLAGRSPFDAYIEGDDTAISDSARRGLGVFVGRGTCIECHSGPALSDLAFHDTGVRQGGPEVGDTDLGRGGVTGAPADDGAFLTAALRNVAKTGPYMHDGVFDSLADVIAFYRRGGDATGYRGTKDPRIVPLDMTDDDARDLEELLRALTEPPVETKLRAHLCPVNDNPGYLCGTTCADVLNDPQNCGSCGHTCTGNCMAGTCL